MSRSSWLAIRAPLSPHRATVAKFAAFLLPLAAWALICLVWVPDIVITDQGDGRYRKGDRVERTKFDAENASILASRTEPTLKLTDESFQALRAAGVPEPVLAKLDHGREEHRVLAANKFVDNFSAELNKDEVTRYQSSLLEHAEKETKQLEVGDPSTVVWLPPPHQVAQAFYRAFVTPPVGRGSS